MPSRLLLTLAALLPWALWQGGAAQPSDLSMARLTLAYHAISVAMLVGSVMARAWHRIACAWMQCDEAL